MNECGAVFAHLSRLSKTSALCQFLPFSSVIIWLLEDLVAGAQNRDSPIKTVGAPQILFGYNVQSGNEPAQTESFARQ